MPQRGRILLETPANLVYLLISRAHGAFSHFQLRAPATRRNPVLEGLELRRLVAVSLDPLRGGLSTGGDGDDLIQGGTGKSFINGGNGNDTMSSGLASDLIVGGAGIDTVDYSARVKPMAISLDGIGNDGQSLERDNVAFDVEIV